MFSAVLFADGLYCADVLNALRSAKARSVKDNKVDRRNCHLPDFRKMTDETMEAAKQIPDHMDAVGPIVSIGMRKSGLKNVPISEGSVPVP